MCLSEHAARRIFIAFNWSNISQAMVSKKVILARAAEASRKTSPDEASWHSSRNAENKLKKSHSFIAKNMVQCFKAIFKRLQLALVTVVSKIKFIIKIKNQTKTKKIILLLSII